MRQIGEENVECDPAEGFFGHATAPPSNVMKWRRFMSPRRENRQSALRP